ncbi:MAG TPA: class Ib ribonucleoside-diphosphate reductase assembly flavoprotein NrdI, partial [Enterobacteriaceae bacterium]|nr:class Ib ribonucleoside-diphosphate reductase assembly flavoprotein NrdI [Enterobacteriaceae bacterium]
MSQLVYFSSRSENTHRFIQRLGLPALRIAIDGKASLKVDQP